ncbi:MULTISPECIES: DJ-1/PfpI family protein [unclassified Maribacter]|uniref:DJ-1/PfpI family protein n=1 Tax=unclassified Maribacter TaxID=2615042 RepID=UPI000EE54EC4|nr:MULTISPECIES: DJ-1/PfpI family protein [unclassified Maribacter]HAI44403.1 glutamine amidotransferase [Maribacter sp.]|tara:strand:- start:270 stop:1010 length:741 start_codon:yes stop_codon:yes gene_type:complete
MKLKYLLILLPFILVSCNQKKAKKETTVVKETRQLPKLEPSNYNVAFLIMNGTFNTEFTAPFDIFQHTKFRKGIKAMNTFTVANTLEPITTFEGVRILPDFDYTKDDLPKIDILVVPSAEHSMDSDLKDEVMINFIKQIDKSALYMTSHCDGAFPLAKAGILDSVASTTFPSDIENYKAMFPNLDIKDNVLFVHDGKYITSAGGAKSFEAALYLCEILYGKHIAKSLAKGLVIDWKLEDVPHITVQ